MASGFGYTEPHHAYTVSKCLPNDFSYTFTMFDSSGNGISNWGWYSIVLDHVFVAGEVQGNFGYSHTIQFSTPTIPPISCVDNEALFQLLIRTDNYPDESTWELRDNTNQLIVWGDGYQSPTHSYTEYVCIRKDAFYTFTIYDSFGDGICCAEGFGSYSIKYDGVLLVGQGGEFESSETIQFGTPIPPPGSSCGNSAGLLELILRTDDYPSETSWELVDNNSDWLSTSGVGYFETRTYAKFFCLPKSGSYTFSIYDSYGDGICCAAGFGGYSIKYNGVIVGDGGDFEFSEHIQFLT